MDKDLLEQQGKAYQIAGVDEAEDAREQFKAKKRKKNGDDDEGKVGAFHPHLGLAASLPFI